MLQPGHLDFQFLNFAARFLICFTLPSSIFQTGFARLRETFDSGINLLIADVVLYGCFAVVLSNPSQ